jgi:hypothetical protein
MGDRFCCRATGGQGGRSYRSGVNSGACSIRHDATSGGAEISGFLVDGVPHIEISLTSCTPPRVLYRGPLAPQPDPEAWPFELTSEPCGSCGRPLRAFEVSTGLCPACIAEPSTTTTA